MRNNLFLKKPPKQYIDNFIKYAPGFDTFPELIDFVKNGFTLEEAERMRSIFRIEKIKYLIESAKSDEDINDEEINEGKKILAAMISDYNKGYQKNI